MDKAVKAYNDRAIVMDFATLRSKTEPMKSAIEQLSIATIESKANKQKDSEIITYTLEPTTKQIDLGKTPTSNTQILKQLQSIVDAIIYEAENDHNSHKVTTHDANYVVATMTKRGGSGKVVAPRPATMHTLIMDVLHRIITNGDYKVEYMTKKQAKDEAADGIKTKIVSITDKPLSE